MNRRILVADDDPTTRLMLKTLLSEWGYQTVETEDGTKALEALQKEDAPSLCIIDWLMPGIDGIDVCRTVRKQNPHRPCYFLLLTIKKDRSDMVEALEAGADDFITKPFDYEELRVRLQVGSRVIRLQERLAARAQELQDALQQVKTLKNLLPICLKCKKIRNDDGYWQRVENYVETHLDVRFSHGLCPHCAKEMYPDFLGEPSEDD